MKEPQSNTLYVAQKFGQKVAQKLGQEQYSRTPVSVLYDAGLTFSARCVYAAISVCVFQGTVARVGQRELSKRLGASRNTVEAGVAELAARGHIVVRGTGKERRTYHLTSSTFGTKQRDGVTEVVSSPRSGRRFVSIGKEKMA